MGEMSAGPQLMFTIEGGRESICLIFRSARIETAPIAFIVGSINFLLLRAVVLMPALIDLSICFLILISRDSPDER
jgi:hypothetical protein